MSVVKEEGNAQTGEETGEEDELIDFFCPIDWASAGRMLSPWEYEWPEADIIPVRGASSASTDEADYIRRRG